MADISTELQAILDAVYGEQVRGSIHDAIEKINEASEVVLSTGNLITYSGSSSQGFYVGSLYLNTDTYTLWKCIGTNSWQNLGVLKGRDGSQGVEGKTGPRGISVREVIPVGEGGFIIRLDDGTDSQTLYAPRGLQGERGLQGTPGTPGRGIANFETSKSGKVTSVTAVYTDGTKQLIANVMDGADGSGAGDMTYATYDPTQSGIVNSARELNNGTEVVTIESILGKADKATTLEGYGIEDAYNTYETQQAISMAVSELNSESVGGEGLYIASVEEVEGILRATAKPFPQISGSWDGITGKPFEEIGEGLSVDEDNVLSVTNNKSILSADYYDPSKYYSKGDLCIFENEIYEQYGYNGVLINNPPTQTAYWRKRSLSEINAKINDNATSVKNLIERFGADGNGIPANSDLNDYKNTGMYYITGANASSVANKPASGAQTVFVVGDNVRCMQFVNINVSSASGNTLWFRAWTGSQWFDWKKII